MELWSQQREQTWQLDGSKDCYKLIISKIMGWHIVCVLSCLFTRGRKAVTGWKRQGRRRCSEMGLCRAQPTRVKRCSKRSRCVRWRLCIRWVWPNAHFRQRSPLGKTHKCMKQRGEMSSVSPKRRSGRSRVLANESNTKIAAVEEKTQTRLGCYVTALFFSSSSFLLLCISLHL